MEICGFDGTWFRAWDAGYMVSSLGDRTHSFELGVQGTWFREDGVPGFESMGYIVLRVRVA